MKYRGIPSYVIKLDVPQDADLSLRESVELSNTVRTPRVSGVGIVTTVPCYVEGQSRTCSSGYTASKFGVNGFSEALRQEATTVGIWITVIESGAVDTAMQIDEVRAQLRMLEPEDIANAVVYAIS